LIDVVTEKKKMRQKLLLCLSAMTLLLTQNVMAQSQSYPNKPIRMIVGFAPGGSADISARFFAEAMTRELKETVVVENKGGAGGNIAAAEVARAEPDGYTIFYATSAIVLGPLLYQSVKYDPFVDFSPVMLTATNPLVFLTAPSLAPRSLKEFVAYAKAQGNMNYGSSGAGTMTHLPSAAFAREFGLETSHIAYKGESPALVDVASGRTQFMISTLSAAVAMMSDARVRALAVAATQRSPLFPDVPTFNEALGTTDWVMGAWQGVVVPKGVAPEIIKKLGGVLATVLQDPALKTKLAPQGTVLLGGTPAQFTQYMKEEQTRWKKIITESGAKVE
jgi:tripartite-type tricarboxylate transporter receptor subunit TctC